jgi:geranylgeranyl diphosphate synthase, type II
MFDLSAYLAEKRRVVENALDMHMPSEETRPSVLHTAMRYSVFSGGKRLRPILCLAAASAVKGNEEDALLPAIALEVLHTYTLVHDDLPAMDDDELRRGQPTTHVEFGEANAILAGDALLTLAFEWMGQCRAPAPYLPGQYVIELAEAAGSSGVIAGQVEDLAAETEPPTPERLDFIHLHKTAALIRAAVRIGAISGGVTGEHLDAMSVYGCNIGIAFQITDDLLDERGETERIGKPAGSDRKNSKLTYVSLYGVEESEKRARHLVDEALETLAVCKGPTEPLEAIARYILARQH